MNRSIRYLALSAIIVVTWFNQITCQVWPMPSMVQPRWVSGQWDPQAPKPDQYWWQNRGQPLIYRDMFIQDLINGTENDFRAYSAWSQQGFGAFIQPIFYEEYERRNAILQGNFKFFTVQNLNQALQIQSRVPQTKSGRLKVLVWDPYYPWEVDIRYLQAHPSNQYALFQVASTSFGPLEGGMASQNSYLSHMLTSAVQGEEATISTAGALFWRKYYMGAPYYLLGNLSNQIYVYPNTINVWYDNNHNPRFYLQQGNPQVDRNWIFGNHNFTNEVNNTGFGLHSNIAVTSGYGDSRNVPNGRQQQLPINVNNQSFIDSTTTQLVHHHLSGALNLNRYQPTTQNIENAAKIILYASYYSAIKSALYLNTNQAWLTLMGGGSFQNDIRWISDTIYDISQQHKKLLNDYGLQTTLIYRPDKPRQGGLRNAQTDLEFFYGYSIKSQSGFFHKPGMLEAMDAVNGTQLATNQRLRNQLNEYLPLAYRYMSGQTTQEKRIHELATEINRQLMQLQPARPLAKPASQAQMPARAQIAYQPQFLPVPQAAPAKPVAPVKKTPAKPRVKKPTKPQKKKVVKPKAKKKVIKPKARKPQRLKKRKVVRRKKVVKAKKKRRPSAAKAKAGRPKKAKKRSAKKAKKGKKAGKKAGKPKKNK